MKNLKLNLFHPLVFFPLAALMVFAPCLLGGNAYFDGDLLAAYVPMRIFLKSCLAQGHFPLWCPYLLGGQPFFADPNTMSAYPFTYLLLPLPVPYGFSVFYFLHFLLAAWGMYFWAGTLGLSKEPRLLAGLLLAFSGFFWWEIIHPPLLAAFAWMPWWGGTLEKVSKKLEPAWAFAAGLVFALLFLSGSFQMTLGSLYGGGLYLAYRLLTRREWRGEPQKDKRLLGAPLCFIWGALPLLLLWIPAREFLNLSGRLHASTDYLTFQADLSLDPRTLLHFLFPVRPFNPVTGEVRPLEDYLVNAGYLGPWAVFLSVLALKKWKGIVRFLAVAGTLAVLTAFGKYFPLHRILCFLAPGFELMRAPYRYLFLYSLAGTLLAAVGFESLMAMAKKKGKLPAVLFWKGAVPYAALVLFLGFWSGGDFVPQCAAAILGCVALYPWLRGKKYREWPSRAFLLALLTALLPAAWLCGSSRWGPPSNFNYVDRSKELQKLAEDSRGGRALIGDRLPYPVEYGGKMARMELPPDAVYASHTRIAFGYNPLSLDRTTDLYTLPPKTFLGLMAVRCYATGGDRWKIPGFTTERRNGIAYGLNPGKAPFVYSPGKAVALGDDSLQLEAMRRQGFDPVQTAYFSGELPDSLKGDGVSARLEYEWLRDDPDDESFKVSLNRAGWVVFSEVMYPGWKAWVDGNSAALYTANHSFRAVWVPEGNHEVTFRYEPVWWKPLLGGLILWLLSVMGIVISPWWKKFVEEFKN